MESTYQDLLHSLQEPAELPADDIFYVTESDIPVVNDEDFSYEELPVVHYCTSDEEEDFDRANKALLVSKRHADLGDSTQDRLTATLSKMPEVVEDFVKNFLVEEGMLNTLGTFQAEWHRLRQVARLETRHQSLPDCYSQNRSLERTIAEQLQELEKQSGAGVRAGEALVRLRKERDFHRMHHKRLVQEKQRLLYDINRLKQHYSKYPPALNTLKDKYESAIRERMLTRLERDRAVGQVVSLQATLKSLHGGIGGGIPTGPPTRAASRLDGNLSGVKEVLIDGSQPLKKYTDETHHGTTIKALFTTDNPFSEQDLPPCGHLAKTVGFHLSLKNEAHSHGVSDVSFHPNKPVLATGSDDHTWKLWTLPELKLVMSGEGHHDWIASCRFHPSGHRLATGSGDSSVKIWDFSKGSCVQTLNEHTHGIWSVSWYWGGDYLASGSQDHHIKIWDVETGTCRSTLRGHSEAVTCVQFLPCSQLILSSSADKRAALWDARNGLCVQTYSGHSHAVNWCCTDLKGIQLATCDAFGQVNLWDLRQHILTESIDFGPHMANRLEFDTGGACLGVAMGNGTIKMYNIAQQTLSELSEHEESVQCLCFHKEGEYLVSGCSEGYLYLWS